ncbi:hypothetical protein D3C87_1849470 [compost metagenome]
MEIKPVEKDPEDEAIERDLASDRSKNNGTWDKVAQEAALNAQVNQPKGDWQ